MRLSELKNQALHNVALGEWRSAFDLFRLILESAPMDLDARMKVADLCVTMERRDLAIRVYAACAYFDIHLGRPLHAIVVAQALRELGADPSPFHQLLAELYSAASPRIARGGGGARLSPLDPETEVSPLMMDRNMDLSQTAEAAAAVASSTAHFTTFPEQFPPVPLLSELAPETFARVLGTVKVCRFAHDTLVIREGDPGQSFFFVAGGHVRVFTTGKSGAKSELARLGEGAVFGELALVAQQPRSASVTVEGEADLLEFETHSLRSIAHEPHPVAEVLDRFTRDRLLKNLIARSPLFRPFSQQQRLDLVRRFTGHEVSPGTDVIRQGDSGRGLFIVLSGEMEVLKGEEPFFDTVAALKSGDLFGEIALIRGVPATATVRATRQSTVLFLAREYFERLIDAVPEIRSFFEDLTEGRLKQFSQYEPTAEELSFGKDALILL
jgi:CRP-like cAMP-binding protein